MRRRYGLLLAGLLLAAAAYAGFWFFAAGQLRDGIDRWAAEQRALGAEVAYGEPRIGGFPFRLIVEVDDPRLALPGHPQQPSWSAPRLAAVTQPWRINHVLVDLAGAHRLGFHDGAAPRAMVLDAAEGRGSYRADASGRPERLSIDLHRVALHEPGTPLTVRAARLQVHLRPGAASDVTVDAAISADTVTAEGLGPMPFGPEIARAAATASLVGRIGRGGPAEALSGWRDAGGMLDLKQLTLVWGELRVEGEGALALDEALRPIGALTARIAGHGVLVDAAVAEGELSPGEGSMAKVALGGLAAATGGVLSVPVRMQDGRLFLGPVAVARLSPIVRAGGRNP